LPHVHQGSQKNSEAKFYQYTLAQTFRVEGKVKQDAPQELVALANAYFEKYFIKYDQNSLGGASIPPPHEKTEFHNVGTEGLEVEQVHTFGGSTCAGKYWTSWSLKDASGGWGSMPSKRIRY